MVILGWCEGCGELWRRATTLVPPTLPARRVLLTCRQKRVTRVTVKSRVTVRLLGCGGYKASIEEPLGGLDAAYVDLRKYISRFRPTSVLHKSGYLFSGRRCEYHDRQSSSKVLEAVCKCRELLCFSPTSRTNGRWRRILQEVTPRTTCRVYIYLPYLDEFHNNLHPKHCSHP